MTIGSLFDGSGGFPLGGVIAGIEPLWASEIEPYPLKVTAARFPEMKQLGDVTKINGAEIDPVDIITFGSPCQDLSVAGKQAGIHEGTRSSLFFEAIRIIREMREETNGKWPSFAVWENVPGAFSSHGGEDFHAVLQALAETAGCEIPVPGSAKWKPAGAIVADGWSIAWRVFDAQYWGVPQRRKRIYLVADFGGQRAGEILFEREGVRGNPAQSGAKREGTAADAEGSAGRSRVFGIDHVITTGGNCTAQGPCWYENICPTQKAAGVHAVCYPTLARSLCARADSSPCVDRGQNIICYQNTGRRWWNEGEVAETPRTPCGGDSTKANLVVAMNAMGVRRASSLSVLCYEGQSVCTDTDKAFTLQAGRPDQQHIPNVVYDARGNGDGKIVPCCTWDHENRVTDYTAIVCENSSGSGIASTLDASYHKGTGARNGKEREYICEMSDKPPRKYIVRRLTPLECCRLQGFPDWWEDGVEGSDSARYKMWGNGVALPCVARVMQGIMGGKEVSKCSTQ